MNNRIPAAAAGVLLIALLITTAFGALASRATVVWGDDFDDCDYNGWETVGVNMTGQDSIDTRGSAVLAAFEQKWMVTWGHSSGVHADLVTDSSRNVYVACDYNDDGNSDAVVRKYDPTGEQLWNSTWGGPLEESARGIALDYLGNVYVTGTTTSFGADTMMFLVKYSSNGQEVWNVTWAGAPSTHAGGEDVAIDRFGDAYVTGYASSSARALVVKYDSLGMELWNTTFGTTGYSTGKKIAVDGCCNVYIGGNSDPPGDTASSVLVLKLNSSGIIMWNTTWGHHGIDERCRGMAMNSAGEIYISGKNTLVDEMFIVKLDSSGNEIWNLTQPNYQETSDVALDGGGCIYISATDKTGLPVLLQYDSDGGFLWSEVLYGGAGGHTNGVVVDRAGNVFAAGLEMDSGSFLVKYGSTEIPQSWSDIWNASAEYFNVALDSAGNAYAVGQYVESPLDSIIRSDAFISKYSSTGILQWRNIWNNSDDEAGFDIAIDSIGNAYMVGMTQVVGKGSDVFITKYDTTGTQIWNTTWGTSDEDIGHATVVDKSNDIYVAGITLSGQGAFIARFNSTGHEVWNITREMDMSSTVEMSRTVGLDIDSPGNLYLTASYFDVVDLDVILAKFSPLGDSVWNASWATDTNDEAYGIAVDGAGNAFISGTTFHQDPQGDRFLAKFDPDGNQVWNVTLGSSDQDRGYGVAINGENEILTIGAAYDESVVQKYSSSGNILFSYSTQTGMNARCLSIALDGLDNVFAVGKIGYTGPTDDNAYILKIVPDRTGPDSVQLSNPSNDFVTNECQPSLLWFAASDPGGIQGYFLEVDTSILFDSENSVSSWVGNTTSSISPVVLTDGTWFWRVRARDTFGNNGTWSETWSILIDTLLPSLDHQTGFGFEQGTPSHFITWSPSDINPERYELLDNGSVWQSGSWNGASIQLSMDNLTLGIHNITLVVYDAADNWVSDSVSIEVYDTIPPQITAHPDLEFEEGAPQGIINWAAIDLNPSSYEVYRNNILIDSGNWNGQTLVVSLLDLEPGPYNYTLVLIDSTGNRASDSLLVIVRPDTTAPVIEPLADATILDTQSISITWNVSENNPASYLIELNGVEVESGSWNGTNITYVTGFLPAGIYHYTLTVWDLNGNHASDTIIINVAVDMGRALFIGGSLAGGVTIGFIIIFGAATILSRRKRLRILETLMADKGQMHLTEYAEHLGIPVEASSKVVERTDSVMSSSQGMLFDRKQMMETLVAKADEVGIIEIRPYAEALGISFEDMVQDLEKFLKQDQLVIGRSEIIVTTRWIAELRSKATEIGILNLAAVAVDIGISVGTLKILLTTYVSGSFDAHRRTFVVGATRVESVVTSKEAEPEVQALRGGEFVGNRFRFKVKVINESDFVITDVTVTLLSYPRDTLKLEGESTKTIAKIDPNGFRSPTFDFLPTEDCVKGDVIASVSFVDSRGQAHSVTTEPFTIRAVCDLLRPETTTPEEFELKLSSLNHGEMASRVEDWTPEEMYSKTMRILESSNFYQVTNESREIGEHMEFTVSGWARGVYTGNSLGVQITITGRPGIRGATCKVRMSGEDEAMIMPAIDEISQKLNAWLCPMCGGRLPIESVDELKAGKSVACPFCGVTIDR